MITPSTLSHCSTRGKPLPRVSLPTGAVIYRGPSMLDGSPIVAILTGLGRKSMNRKTGDMVQLWIMRDDIDPVETKRLSLDYAVCGDCPQRQSQGGHCYVVLVQAPLTIWRADKRGGVYADWTQSLQANALRGRSLRIGAYGDPAALPESVLRRLLRQKLKSHTGYTHQWRATGSQWLRGWIMASVDSESEAEEARSAGWRYFRVTDDLSSRVETLCPASDEGGNRTDCASCGLCEGQQSGAKSIVILAHGSAV